MKHTFNLFQNTLPKKYMINSTRILNQLASSQKPMRSRILAYSLGQHAQTYYHLQYQQIHHIRKHIKHIAAFRVLNLFPIIWGSTVNIEKGSEFNSIGMMAQDRLFTEKNLSYCTVYIAFITAKVILETRYGGRGNSKSGPRNKMWQQKCNGKSGPRNKIRWQKWIWWYVRR